MAAKYGQPIGHEAHDRQTIVVADVIGLPPLSPHIGDRRYFDGEEKHLSKYDEDGLCLELLQPFRANALPTEYSKIEIRYHSRKVFCIRWDRANHFKVVMYEPGDWEQTLLDWWEPIPFD